MSTWGEILKELKAPDNRLPNGRPDYDRVRRRYLQELSAYTKRTTIIYATAWTDESVAGAGLLSINLGDVQGFMEAVSATGGGKLDLILHSPGGSAEAAESIVEYLRTKFSSIRVIVPLAAMSAATMIALSADSIVMGRHSQLGPIDPQFTIVTPEGSRSAPGKAILDQFNRAKVELSASPSALAAWLPILRSYAPGLLSQCVDQQELARQMVRGWLERYMFTGDAEAAQKAHSAAQWFADPDNFGGSHGRAVRIEKALAQGLKVELLEDDQTLQDAVLSVFHATTHTFNGTGAVKIIENHHGRAYVLLARSVVMRARPGDDESTGEQENIPRAERRRRDKASGRKR